MPQEVVDLLSFQHSIVSLAAVDGRTARIGEVAHQLRVLLFGKSLQHRPHATELLGHRRLLAPVHILVNLPLVLIRVCKVVVTLVLSQLLVDLLLPVRGEMQACERIGNHVYLAVCQIFEYIHQVTAGLD